MTGTVEEDETFVGGKPRGPRESGHRRISEKVIVFGMKERGGDVRSQVVGNNDRESLSS
jgi:hypothetical protein